MDSAQSNAAEHVQHGREEAAHFDVDRLVRHQTANGAIGWDFGGIRPNCGVGRLHGWVRAPIVVRLDSFRMLWSRVVVVVRVQRVDEEANAADGTDAQDVALDDGSPMFEERLEEPPAGKVFAHVDQLAGDRGGVARALDGSAISMCLGTRMSVDEMSVEVECSSSPMISSSWSEVGQTHPPCTTCGSARAPDPRL